MQSPLVENKPGGCETRNEQANGSPKHDTQREWVVGSQGTGDQRSQQPGEYGR